MPRTNKNHSIKRTDILNQVWSIFLTNGYENTTLTLILKELNISKGVFYHYFTSKEDCAKAAVDLYSGMLVEKTVQKCQGQAYEKQHPIQKLNILFEQGKQLFAENPLALDGINSNANRVFHSMLMVSLTKKLAPVFSAVIQEGADLNCFHTKYPSELAEMMLVLSHFYFDSDLFEWDERDVHRKVAAYQELIAKGLDVEVRELFPEVSKPQASTARQ